MPDRSVATSVANAVCDSLSGRLTKPLQVRVVGNPEHPSGQTILAQCEVK
jgi:hypothetical protein